MVSTARIASIRSSRIHIRNFLVGQTGHARFWHARTGHSSYHLSLFLITYSFHQHFLQFLSQIHLRLIVQHSKIHADLYTITLYHITACFVSL